MLWVYLRTLSSHEWEEGPTADGPRPEPGGVNRIVPEKLRGRGRASQAEKAE